MGMSHRGTSHRNEPLGDESQGDESGRRLGNGDVLRCDRQTPRCALKALSYALETSDVR